ncbi:MAG TPA: hypothetical protein VJO72_15855 [Candidatus Dormibacteraeota bacterium]|nr:hypothetical protein [Candidatus Dormibacteraeota bacterium]
MSRRGFTIIEAAIGLLVLALITGAMASTFLVGYTVISKEANQVSADGALSSASLSLLRDLSSATTITSTGTLTPGSGSSLVVIAGLPPTTVTYQIDAQANLTRSVAGGATSVAARGLQSLALTTAGCQLTVTLTPKAIAVAQTLRVTQRIGATGCY